MITIFVTIPIPKELTREQWLEGTKAIASRFQGVPGLVRKNFIFNREAALGGGVYTWDSRELAEKFHVAGGAWHKSLKDRFGIDPTLQYFDSPVIVDNSVGKIEISA